MGIGNEKNGIKSHSVQQENKRTEGGKVNKESTGESSKESNDELSVSGMGGNLMGCLVTASSILQDIADGRGLGIGCLSG